MKYNPADITYIRLLALVAIIDWYSRYVVSWELAQSLEVDFVLVAVNRAFEASASSVGVSNTSRGSFRTLN